MSIVTSFREFVAGDGDTMKLLMHKLFVFSPVTFTWIPVAA